MHSEHESSINDSQCDFSAACRHEQAQVFFKTMPCDRRAGRTAAESEQGRVIRHPSARVHHGRESNIRHSPQSCTSDLPNAPPDWVAAPSHFELQLEVPLLVPLEIAVPVGRLRVGPVGPAHVALARPVPRVALAHQRYAVLSTIKYSPPRHVFIHVVILHEPHERYRRIVVEGLPWGVVLALVMPLSKFADEVARYAATQ